MMPGYTQPLANHLWQSTLFAAGAWLLTLALRRNRASVRCKLWLAASLKFLIPFALLVSAGSQIDWSTGPERAGAVIPLSDIVTGIERPFGYPIPTAPAQGRNPLSVILPAVWLCGFLVVSLSWIRKWREVRAAVRTAAPVPAALPIPVMYSRARLEPGVVGIFRPILLLPEGIAERLTPAQLAAVLAHEMCHVRRRDNLAVALHMVVECLFWFHPIVWWVRQRMLDEREQACDEEVLRGGSEPEAYAEGILNVCRFYLESPAGVVAGVTGADLKKRIEGIMSHRLANDLEFGKRLLLGIAAAVTVAAPIAIGVLHLPELRAQEAATAKFEVASVKASTSPDGELHFHTQPGGRLVATGLPLYLAIEWGYGLPVQSIRISGAPEWTRSARFDIDAKAAAGAIPADLPGRLRDQKMRPMMLALLAERFKLSVRAETKEMPVYLVTVAKGGPKMEKSTVEEKDCGADVPCHGFMGGQGRGVHGKSASVEDLLTFVENWSDRPLIDRTELPGLYNMDSDGWVPLRSNPTSKGEGFDDPTRQTLFTVFERQLGLKIESGKAPVTVYIVEHVERPTGN
jgi:bla regulator protein BlaR1